MKRLAIIGCGDLGQQIAYHAFNDNHYQPVGFFDDNLDIHSNIKLPLLGKIEDVQKVYNTGFFDFIMIGLGYRYFDLREQLFNQFKNIIPFGTIIHSSAYVDSSCKISSGVIIYPRCVLDMNVEIGNNVLLNVGCVIAHDTKIGNYSFLSPAVNVAGFVEIGERVSLGIGTTVIDNIKIENNVKTGGGAVIIENIQIPGLYVGIPAKLKKRYS